MKKGMFILTLLALLAASPLGASPALAGWYFNWGYSYYPLTYYRHGGIVFVSYPGQPIYRGYPLFPISGYRTYGYGSSMRTVEKIMAISEEKRILWQVSQQEVQETTEAEPVEPAQLAEPADIPPAVEEVPLKAPKVQTDKSEI